MTGVGPRAHILVTLGLISTIACATREKRDEPQVHSVHIRGVRQEKEKEIKKRLLTAENSWVPFSRHQYFNEGNWKTDLRRIEHFYHSRGYYQAKVMSSEVKPNGKQVDVTATVEEGSPSHIASLNIGGLEDLPAKERTRLMEEIRLKVGAVFAVEAWEGLKKRMAATLRQMGYAAAVVTGEAKVGLDTQKVDITVNVDHGPVYKFGALRVKQNYPARVEPWRVLELAATETTPGDRYNVKAQSAVESRVFKLGVFGAVRITPLKPDPLSLTVPLEVDVQESRFHVLGYGAGVEVDQTRQQVQATSQFINRDFLGGLRKLTLNGVLGYAWVPTFYASSASGAQRGVTGSLSAELEQPRFFARDLRLDTKVTVERGIEPAYRYYGASSKVGVPWTPTNHFTVTPSYNLEYYYLEAGTAQLGGAAPTLLFGCPANCFLSYVDELVEWDERDDRQEPHSGYYLALDLQEGGGILGGSFDYVRVVPEARGYLSFLEDSRLTLAARVKGGTLIPTNGNDAQSPIVSRFFSGGNDMRGFNSRRLAPQFLVAQPYSTTQGYTVPVGGNGLFESSFETRYAVTDPLVVAAFFDTGFVTSQHFNLSDVHYLKDNMLFAVGGGLRYRTPFAPIRLDFGYRLDIGPALPVIVPPGSERLSYQTRSSCFGIGKGAGPSSGAPEGPCVLHISIGEAF